jgi:hypothetical protein
MNARSIVWGPGSRCARSGQVDDPAISLVVVRVSRHQPCIINYSEACMSGRKMCWNSDRYDTRRPTDTQGRRGKSAYWVQVLTSVIVATPHITLSRPTCCANVTSCGRYTSIQFITALVPTSSTPHDSALTGHKFVHSSAHIRALWFIFARSSVIHLSRRELIWSAATLRMRSIIREGEKAKHGRCKLRSNTQSSTWR